MTTVVPTIPHLGSIADWIRLVEDMERQAFGIDLANLKDVEGGPTADEQRAARFRVYEVAMHHEIVEMFDEVGWKDWVTEQGWSRPDAVADEAADLMIFLACFLVAAGVTPSMLCAALHEKIVLNYERQAKGDVEAERKCPKCKRSLDGKNQIREINHPIDAGRVQVRLTCMGCGHVLSTEVRTYEVEKKGDEP